MARGYPDFFGQSIFPFYGSANDITTSVNQITSGQTKTVFLLERKGLLYGGHLRIYSQDDTANIRILPFIDGTAINTYTIEELFQYRYGQDIGYIFKLVSYDIIGKTFTLCLAFEATFGVSIQVDVENATSGTIDIAGKLYYAQVT